VVQSYIPLNQTDSRTLSNAYPTTNVTVVAAITAKAAIIMNFFISERFKTREEIPLTGQ
jgi:hypothetical protein